MTRAEFAEAAFSYCVLTGANVTSWIRTPRHNLREKGVAHSAHLVGLGLDVTYDIPVDLAERRAWASRLGLRLLAEEDHDHLQPETWVPG